MITVIAFNDFLETIIKKYDVVEIQAARDLFVKDWIKGVIGWNNFEYWGEGCTVDNPAFTPEFLQNYNLEEPFQIVEGVHIYQWSCITGIHGSDEHFVNGYFIPTKDYIESEFIQ